MQDYHSNKDAYDHIGWGVLFFIVMVLFLLSCGNSKKDKQHQMEKESEAILLAAVTHRDTSKFRQIMWMKRTIKAKPLFDSTLNEYITVVDTVIGYPVNVPKVDSLNRPIMGADGKPVIDPIVQYLEVAESFEDSVDFHVEGIPMDSLLRKK